MYLVKCLSRDKGPGRYTKFSALPPYRFLRGKRKGEGCPPDTLPQEGGLCQIQCHSVNTHRGKHRLGGAQKLGLSERVSHGVSLAPFAPRAQKRRKTVPRVSPECQKGVPNTSRTLLDTPRPGLQHRPFSGTLLGHSQDPSGPKGLHDSCSRLGGSQPQLTKFPEIPGQSWGNSVYVSCCSLVFLRSSLWLWVMEGPKVTGPKHRKIPSNEKRTSKVVQK